jgi:ComF family protein
LEQFLISFICFFPENCSGCNKPLLKNESSLCVECQSKLPRTYFETEQGNVLEKLFYGRCMVQKAVALFYFRKDGLLQRVLHELKYRNHDQLGVKLGAISGNFLAEVGFVDDIDLMIPIPLHPKKEKKRGYNQSLKICQGLSESLGIDYHPSAIIRKVDTNSQTKQERMNRWDNVAEIFEVIETKALENKHILLVDDVITTGSTMEACVQKLNEVKGVKVSVFALATPERG